MSTSNIPNYCPNCKRVIDNDSKYCRHCGMEIKIEKEEQKDKSPYMKYINISLILIAIGIWIIILQNFGVLPQKVYVENTVGVDGNVNVNNVVEVDVARINGHGNVFYNNPQDGDSDKYYVIPVKTD